MAKTKVRTPATFVPTLPVGVYTNHNRNSAIAFKHSATGVWYLTFITGKVTLEHAGEEKFKRDFPLVLQDYPLLRAVRKYDASGLDRDEQTKKVLRALLRM